MSRQPSPAPNHSAHIHSQMYQSSNAPAAASSSSSAKQPKQKYVPGITAGAEDIKYQTKYKELKKKVKEIEFDNDRLYLKLLLAKKNIRRMNLERAILYERLAAVPPTPGRHPQDLPPEQDPVFAPRQLPEHMAARDDRAILEYMNAYPHASLVYGPQGQIVAIENSRESDPRAAPLVPPPHGIPIVHGFRHDSGPGYDPNRQLPPLPPAPSAVIATVHDRFPEPPPPPLQSSHSSGYHSAASYPVEHHTRSHSNSSAHHLGHSHHQSRTSSGHGDLDQIQGEHSRMESLTPVHAVHSRRSSIHTEDRGEGGRDRRHDVHELTHHHLEHPHIQIPVSPPSPSSTHSPTNSRDSRPPGRIHNHQRVGPGANINRERDPEYERQLHIQRDIEREQERERERERADRLRMLEEQEREYRSGGGGGQWLREDQGGLIGPGMAHVRSRSDTPASGSGHEQSSRPPSGQSSYERERSSRSYAASAAPRVSNLLGLDQDSMYDPRDERTSNTRMLSAEIPVSGSSMGMGEPSRKRSRNDMDVDDERGGGSDMRSPVDGSGGSTGMDESMGMSHERGSKRVHQDERAMTPVQVSMVRDEPRMDQDD